MPDLVFTRQAALAAGLTRSQVETALRTGRWTALVPGAYVESSHLAAADERARHLLHARALLLTVGPEHVLSHRSAAVAHGWPLLGPLPRRPLLSRPHRCATDSSPHRFVRVVRLPPAEVVDLGGIRATAPARTAVDVARHESRASGLVVLDAALRAGVDPELLEDTAHRLRAWPGGRQALAAVGLADGRADGPLETLARLVFADGGLPPPELQVPIRDVDGRLLGIVDFLWRAERTAGEVDGLLKYTTPLDLRREKLREDALRRAGLEVVRAGWEDVTRRPRELCHRVLDAFALAGHRLGVPAGFVLPPAA